MKSKQLLREFTKYCEEHKDERFFQALRNWMHVDAICVARGWVEVGGDTHASIEYVDTYYWEDKSDLEIDAE